MNKVLAIIIALLPLITMGQTTVCIGQFHGKDVCVVMKKNSNKPDSVRIPINTSDAKDACFHVKMGDVSKLRGNIFEARMKFKEWVKVADENNVADFSKDMPTKFPYVIWLWGLLGEIDEINTRIDILHKMQEVATKCFEDVFQARDFREDCNCLIYVYQGSLQYNTKNIGLRHCWTDDKKHLNDLAHILCKEMVDPKFMVAIAEEMYQASQGDRKQAMLTLVLRASRNIGHVSMDNIIDFAKNLYIAEGFRHLILSGEEDYRDIPPLAEFDPKLLKACFEEYIRLRNLEIKDIIEQDLTHCGDAEELECLEYLFEEESQYVNRENMLEDFQGSAAYNAMWYPGKQKVLDMINVFVEYLKNKIKKLKKEEAKLGIRDNIQNFNVQGDYVAGDKHVGAHIDNVSPGAIGAQTTKD